MLDLLQIVLASAAGWAIFGAALVIIAAMHVGKGRWFTAAAWIGTAVAAAWLAVMPGARHEPAGWPVTMLAITLAVICWMTLPRLQAFATSVPRRRVPWPFAAVLFLSGCLVAAPVLALTVEGSTITLTDEEKQRCEDDGGRMIVSRGVFLRAMKKAQDEGFAKACGS